MNFLIFQHLDVEHPGVFREFWKADGISWTTIALNEGDAIPDDLERYDALAVMGGPMDTWQTDLHPWLIPEIAAIRHYAITLHKPSRHLLRPSIAGLCLSRNRRPLVHSRSRPMRSRGNIGG